MSPVPHRQTHRQQNIGLNFKVAATAAAAFASAPVSAKAAELGSLSSGAKMAMKVFVKRVFTIFASNVSFLRVIANLQN